MRRTRRCGYLALLAAGVLGTVSLRGALGPRGAYMGRTLCWSTPVLALQWAAGAELLVDVTPTLLPLLAVHPVKSAKSPFLSQPYRYKKRRASHRQWLKTALSTTRSSPKPSDKSLGPV